MNEKSTTLTDQLDEDDAPRLTKAWAAKAELRHGDVIAREASPKVRIGRPPKSAAERKQQVTLRLDPVLLDTMRRSGKGWQRRAEEVLLREFGQLKGATSMAELGKIVASAGKSAADKVDRKSPAGAPRRAAPRKKSA